MECLVHLAQQKQRTQYMGLILPFETGVRKWSETLQYAFFKCNLMLLIFVKNVIIVLSMTSVPSMLYKNDTNILTASSVRV